jgi:hypothetical protein
MAVEFLVKAKARLPGACDVALDDAAGHYALVRDKLRTLADLHPDREKATDWATTFASPEGAQLVREAAEAERAAVACLKQIVQAL